MKIPDNVDPELWERLLRQGPEMAAILSRMSEVMQGLTCEEKLRGVLDASISFSTKAGAQIRALQARVAELENELRAVRAQ